MNTGRSIPKNGYYEDGQQQLDELNNLQAKCAANRLVIENLGICDHEGSALYFSPRAWDGRTDQCLENDPIRCVNECLLAVLLNSGTGLMLNTLNTNKNVLPNSASAHYIEIYPTKMGQVYGYITVNSDYKDELFFKLSVFLPLVEISTTNIDARTLKCRLTIGLDRGISKRTHKVGQSVISEICSEEINFCDMSKTEFLKHLEYLIQNL